MSLAAELVDKLRALGLPESYDAILLDEGVENKLMLDATSIDDLKELGFKGAHARALKKAFDPAPVQFIAPSPSPAPAPSPSPSATKKKTKTKKRAQPKAPEAPQAGGSYAPPQSQADPRYGQSPAASKMMQAPGKAPPVPKGLSAELNPEEVTLVEQLKYQFKTMKPVTGRRISAHLASRFLIKSGWKPPAAWLLVERFAEVYGERGLLEVNPMAPSVMAKLQTGQFVSYERNGFGFLIFRADRHFAKYGALQSADDSDLIATLAAAMYHLATLTESLVVQRNGITFLYDMTDAGWHNADAHLSSALMELLQAFPVKMMPSFLINAPFWVRASYSFVTSMTGGPILSAALPGHVPPHCLPHFLGGSIQWTDEVASARLTACIQKLPEAGRFSNAVGGKALTSGGPADVVATPSNQRPPPMWYAGRTTPIDTCRKAIKTGKNGDFLIRVTPDGTTAILMVKDKSDIAEFPIDIASGKFICGKVEHKNLEHVVANLSRIPVMNPKTKRTVQLNRAANFGRLAFDPLAAAPQLMRPKAQPDIEKPRLITISRTSPTEMLGLKVYTLTDGSRGNRVGAIIPEKAASRSKGLMLNDVIMEVDEKKCLDSTHDQVMGLLKRAGQVLTMKVVSPAGVPLKTEEEKEAAKNAAAAAAAKVAAVQAVQAVQAGSLPPLPNSPAKAVRSRPAQQKRQPPPPWYAGKTTPLATCIKMVKSGKTGCFLIRVGGDSKRAFLMVNDDKEVAEFVIDLEGGKFEFGGRPHKNLEEIVENLKVAAIRGLSGRPITLTKPATMPTRKKKKGTKAAEAAKQQGYASAVPSQRDAAKGTAPTLTSAQGADRVEEAPPPVPSRAAKPSSSTAVRADAFDEHVRELRGDGAVAALFDQIQVEAQANPGTYDNAKAAENKTKNRYSNVHPYDHSRVVLAYPEGTGTGDYINANYVDGYAASQEYICCQGPLPNTVQDFWWLVWQEGVETIAMLNKLEENGRKKCEKYWPDADETMVHGPVSITGAPAEDAPATDVVKRTFTISVEGAEPRAVTQYQFTGWPDFGIPNTADGVLDICRIVETSKDLASAKPTIVHCSAGIGRTGTFCTIDIGRKMIRSEESVDVMSILKKLRTQRAGMVQAKEQLDFCYQALLEHIEMTRFMNNDAPLSSSADEEVVETFQSVFAPLVEEPVRNGTGRQQRKTLPSPPAGTARPQSKSAPIGDNEYDEETI